MAITVTPVPQYAVVAKPPKLSFAVGAGGGQKVRLFVTDAPVGSKLKQALLDQQSSQLRVHDGDIATPFLFEVDLPGAYTLLAQEIQIPKYGGGYAGDTRGLLDTVGGKSAEKVLSEATVVVYIGARVTGTIGAQPHTADLVMWVWGDTIRPTTTELHGEVSPDIVNPSSDVAKTAANDVTVRSALRQFENQDAATVLYFGTTFAAMINQMIAVLNAHFSDTVGHDGLGDEPNFIPAAYEDPDGKVAIIKSMTKIVDAVTKHMTSDASLAAVLVVGDPPPGFGPGTGGWHSSSGRKLSDSNALLVSPPTDLMGCWAAYADVVRVFVAHTPKTPIHNIASFPTPPPMTRFSTLHKAFLDVVAGMSPTPAPDENPGATLLVHDAGLELS